MKRILQIVCFGTFLLPASGFAQQAKEGTIKVANVEKPGFIATSKHNHTEVEEVFTQRLTTAGIKKHGKKAKFYTGVLLTDISPTKIDFYYKVQKKKHKSQIFIVASKGYDNYITTTSDPAAATNISNFIGSIDAAVERNKAVAEKAAELEATNKNLKKQEDDVTKAEKENAKKAKELKDLENSK